MSTLGNSEELINDVLASLSTRDRVAGLTHDLYRYPARFPPAFVRATIAALTDPGDLVLDPFVGGGTSAVEALALGRRFVGMDLNELAVFVSRAKTTLLTRRTAQALSNWAEALEAVTSPRHAEPERDLILDFRIPWHLRRTLALGLENAALLPNRRVRRLARASLLKVGQWALDGRKLLPGRSEFLKQHRLVVTQLVEGSLSLSKAASEAFGLPPSKLEAYRKIVHAPAESIAARRLLRPGEFPRLVVTSPPYHGVHILYHRWQVQGRRETSAPYWLSGCRDGMPASYYTFGPRVRAGSAPLKQQYFRIAEAAFTALAQVCGPKTLVVQLVGFSDPPAQLPLYEQTMLNAGFVPMSLSGRHHTPFSRDVPNRKWYLDALKRTTPSSREFLLVHRLDT